MKVRRALCKGWVRFPPAAEAKLYRNGLKHLLKSVRVSHSNSDHGPWIWECKWVRKNIYSV